MNLQSISKTNDCTLGSSATSGDPQVANGIKNVSGLQQQSVSTSTGVWSKFLVSPSTWGGVT